MPLLQVRDFPDDLYDTLSRTAKNDNRSIAQETIVLLRRALGQPEARISRREAVLKEIQKVTLQNSDSFPEPADLIREDRGR
jgi:plasmid stability protein